MITLKTLPQATAQEVFDQVANHLLKQNKRSSIDGGCRYKGPDGLACAAGCLIGDDEYCSYFEGKSWGHLSHDRYATYIPKDHFKLIAQLQDIHDCYEPESWRDLLNKLAERNQLKGIE
jgi:hypothetical protein